jgi:hypothetical protein
MKILNHTFRYILIAYLIFIGVITVSSAQQQSNVVFRDDFVGKSLNPDWEIMEPDKDRWTFMDNQFLTIVTAKKGTNAMQFNGALPDNYEVMLKIQTPPQYGNQIVSLSLSRDDSNQVSIEYYPKFDSNPRFAINPEVNFSKTLRGVFSPIPKEIKKLSQDMPLYLKLSKHGNEYIGAYSTDGSRWINIGNHIFIDLNGKPTFEAYNWPTIWSKPPESGIRFDYFEIKRFSQ